MSSDTTEYFARMVDGTDLAITKEDFKALHRSISNGKETGLRLANGGVLRTKYIMFVDVRAETKLAAIEANEKKQAIRTKKIQEEKEYEENLAKVKAKEEADRKNKAKEMLKKSSEAKKKIEDDKQTEIKKVAKEEAEKEAKKKKEAEEDAKKKADKK